MPADTQRSIAIVVLAAGRSSRMGGMKLLLPLGGRPVIAHVAAAALASSLRPVVVVLGHQANEVASALPSSGPMVLTNANYQQGQSTSLRAGIAALPPDTTGAIIMLGDQPLVTAAILERLAAAAATRDAPIIAASYGGQRGNPVYFHRLCFPELLAVQGDEGGRGVIARHSHDLALVKMQDTDAALDVDSPDDYARLCALWARRHPTPP